MQQHYGKENGDDQQSEPFMLEHGLKEDDDDSGSEYELKPVHPSSNLPHFAQRRQISIIASKWFHPIVLAVSHLLFAALAGIVVFLAVQTTNKSIPLDTHKTGLTVDQIYQRTSNSSRVGQITLKYGTGSRHHSPELEYLNNKTLETHLHYARRWGNALWIGKEEILIGPQDGSTTGMWSKQALVLSIILDELRKPKESRLEWLSYADVDAIFANQNVPLDTFLPPDNEFGQGISLLTNIDRWGTLNAGSFMFRVSQDSVRMLTAHLSYPFIEESKGHKFWMGEQSAMAALMKNPHLREKAAIVPAHWLNPDAHAYFNPKNLNDVKYYQYGDMIVHFMSPEKFGWAEVLHSALQYDNKTIAPPLVETRYIRENGHDRTVKQYWDYWEHLDPKKRLEILDDASKRED